MSSPVLVAVATLIRDLLTHNEQLIRIGRQNFEREEFETDYIVVDALGLSQRIGSLEEYDGDTENLSLGHMWRTSVTVDFYGPGAYSNQERFALLLRTQTALDLKKSLSIDVHQASTCIDLKALTGQQYGNRVQLELSVISNSQIDVTTLRIDTAQLEIRTEEGVQYVG